MGAARSKQEPLEWQIPAPYFRVNDIVQLKEEVLNDASTASYFVVDSFTGSDAPVLPNTYFLRHIDVNAGGVEQGVGLAKAPETIIPFAVAELPLQLNLQNTLAEAKSAHPVVVVVRGRPVLSIEQKDCQWMETPDIGICSTETNIASDAWCDIPPQAYFKYGPHCYDVRELLAHFEYQLTRDARHAPVRPSLPLDRFPVSVEMFEYLVVRAAVAGFRVPSNVMRAMEVYRQYRGIVDDPVFLFFANRYEQTGADRLQQLTEHEAEMVAACVPQDYTCLELIDARRRIAAWRPAQ